MHLTVNTGEYFRVIARTCTELNTRDATLCNLDRSLVISSRREKLFGSFSRGISLPRPSIAPVRDVRMPSEIDLRKIGRDR